jgi:AcrR family transcriptional regulator
MPALVSATMASHALTTTDAPTIPEVEEGAWERRRRLSSLRIELAALHLFAESGFDTITAEHVARSSGISERTFFRYFPAKEDVLLAMPRRVATRLCDAVRLRPPEEQLLESWRQAVKTGDFASPDDMQASLLLRRIVLQAPSIAGRLVADPVPAGLFVAITAERLGTDARDFRTNAVAAAISGALGVAVAQWIADPQAVNVRDVLGQALEALEVIGALRHA